MVDLNYISEQHFEKFVSICEKDYDLDALVWENFSSSVDYYRHCKEDFYDVAPYENCFERLYAWDAEYFVEAPLDCLMDYLERKK